MNKWVSRVMVLFFIFAIGGLVVSEVVRAYQYRTENAKLIAKGEAIRICASQGPSDRYVKLVDMMHRKSVTVKLEQVVKGTQYIYCGAIALREIPAFEAISFHSDLPDGSMIWVESVDDRLGTLGTTFVNNKVTKPLLFRRSEMPQMINLDVIVRSNS